MLRPVTTVHAFLTQVLDGNTACTELPHLTGFRFSAPAYTKARSRRGPSCRQTVYKRRWRAVASVDAYA